jgi:hypothetical protein
MNLPEDIPLLFNRSRYYGMVSFFSRDNRIGQSPAFIPG